MMPFLNPLLRLLPLLAVLLTACSPFDEVELRDIRSMEVLRMDGRQIAVRVDVQVLNPNGYRISVEDPDVDLFLNDTFVGKGLLDSTLVLERRSDQVYPVYLHADLAGGPLMMVMLGGALTGQVKLGVKGTVLARSGMLRKRFPFEAEETIDLRGSRP
jgi:LEA14-like dessication related protein